MCNIFRTRCMFSYINEIRKQTNNLYKYNMYKLHGYHEFYDSGRLSYIMRGRKLAYGP